jgi:hypothetical protein
MSVFLALSQDISRPRQTLSVNAPKPRKVSPARAQIFHAPCPEFKRATGLIRVASVGRVRRNTPERRRCEEKNRNSVGGHATARHQEGRKDRSRLVRELRKQCADDLDRACRHHRTPEHAHHLSLGGGRALALHGEAVGATAYLSCDNASKRDLNAKDNKRFSLRPLRTNLAPFAFNVFQFM